MPDSPAFDMPMGAPKDNDPQIVKVPMKDTDWGDRMSQQPTFDSSGTGPVVHVPNGR